MAALSCGTDALMFGSLTMLASGRFASSPSCVSQSGTRWAGVRSSGRLARILPAREISAVSMVMPVPPVYFLMIGSSEWVASAGASSISVQMILPESVGMLQRSLLVAMRVALDCHRHRQRRDVAGIREHVDAERGRVAAIALRADAGPAGAPRQPPLARGEPGTRGRGASPPAQRRLRKERS